MSCWSTAISQRPAFVSVWCHRQGYPPTINDHHRCWVSYVTDPWKTQTKLSSGKQIRLGVKICQSNIPWTKEGMESTLMGIVNLAGWGQGWRMSVLTGPVLRSTDEDFIPWATFPCSQLLAPPVSHVINRRQNIPIECIHQAPFIHHPCPQSSSTTLIALNRY
jgi:hypothetical protein